MSEHPESVFDFFTESVAVEVPRELVLEIERAWEEIGVNDYIVQAVEFARSNGWTPQAPPSNIMPFPRR